MQDNLLVQHAISGRYMVTLLGDGWVELAMPGWESHCVQVRAYIVDGVPRILGVRLLPREDETVTNDDRVLTSSRLRSLPVKELAQVAVRAGRLDLFEATQQLAEISKRETPEKDPRARSTTQQVADVWQLARHQGDAPRTVVCRELHMSPRTADRYIAEARRKGLLPPSRAERRADSRSGATGEP